MPGLKNVYEYFNGEQDDEYIYLRTLDITYKSTVLNILPVLLWILLFLLLHPFVLLLKN